MELSELKRVLDRHEGLRHQYIFWCEDRSMADVYLAQMESEYGLKRRPRNTMAEAIKEANSPSLFGESNFIYVVRDDEAFARDEKGWDALLALTKGVVVGIYNADKKTAFANAVDAVRFPKTDKGILAKYVIAPACGVDEKRAEALAVACDCLYGLCMLECEKVNALSAEFGVPSAEAFDTLMEKGQLGLDQSNSTFQFVNSFVLGDAKGIIESFAGADPMGYLSLLYMQCKSMYLVQANAGSKNILADTGLTYAQVNAYRHKRHLIRIEALPKVMLCIQRVESGIKLGEVPSDASLRYLMALTWAYVRGLSV